MEESTVENKVTLAEKVLDKNPKADISEILAFSDDDRTDPGIVKAYVFSVIFCPLGLYYFVKFFFIDDAKKQALICLGLTAIMVLIEIWIGNQLFGSFSGAIPATTGINSFGGL